MIIGSGSGNSIVGPEMDSMKVAIVERWTFGGTCLNRGCIPSKMFIYPADVAADAADADNPDRFGITTEFHGADWPAMVQRVFGRIDPIAEGGRQYRHRLPNVTVFEHHARFVGDRTLNVEDGSAEGTTIRGEQIVIAAGARVLVPDVPGLADVPFHTSDTIMRIEQLPEHLVVLGGGFIAAELSHVFRSLGSRVTIINRGRHLLKAEDHDVARAFTEFARRRFDLHTGSQIHMVRATPGGFAVDLTDEHGEHHVEGDALLVATGRVPNGDQLGAEAGGIKLDHHGAVMVDAFGRTSAPGVWALGDVNGRHQLKHMANGEAKVVRHNLMNPGSLRRYDDRPAPHAVFTRPQIGSIGPTETAAGASGQPICVITQPYGAAAYGWAMEDDHGFIKLIGDPATRRLIAAHAFGHEASILVQLLVQGMHLGNTVDEMATGQVWIHPALSEVVEQGLLSLIDAFDEHDATHA